MMWVKWEDEIGTDLVGVDVSLDELDCVFLRDELQKFSCLKYIGFYDDTTFNSLQVDELLVELSIAASFDLTYQQRQELNALNEFIIQPDPMLRKTAFLKFYGE